MKIGIVLPNTPSYSETFFNAKIDKLLESGHDVVLFGNKENEYAKTSVCQPLKQNAFGVVYFCIIVLVYFSKVYKFYKLELASRQTSKRALKNTYLNAHMLKTKLDWLHFGYATSALHRENVAECIQAKMGVSFRGYDLNVYPLQHKNCYHLLFEKVDKVHSVSNYLLEKAYTLGLSKNKPYQIIYDAVAQKYIEDEKSISSFIETRKQTLTIVSVARLNWIKGVQYAIQAMAELKSHTPNFKYRVIGGGTKQELEYMKFLIQDNGLENNVILEGELSHKETLEIVKQADIYVQPSLGEGFCTSVVEAQAMGKVCIVSDAGGLPENIEHNATGWITSKYDSSELSRKIITFMELENIKKIQMSMNGINRVRKLFTIEQQQQHFLNFFSQK